MPPLTAAPNPNRLRPIPDLAVVLTLVAVVAVVLLAPADAQTAGVQITQFPGVPYDYQARRPGETHRFTLDCPAGFFAVAGGWAAVPDTAEVAVVESYPTRLPGAGQAGQWSLAVRLVGRGPATVIPYLSCLGGPGVAQPPE
jgi:hypothetical protein